MRFIHFASLVALLLPMSAAAFDAKATGTGTSMNEAMPIHDGLVVVKVSSVYDGFETDMADNALATAKGPCFGTMIIDKGAVSGGGACKLRLCTPSCLAWFVSAQRWASRCPRPSS